MGHVLVLVHPLAVALEEDLHGGRGAAAQHDGVALDDVGVVGLLQEMGQRPRGRGQGLGQGLAVLIACKENRGKFTFFSRFFCRLVLLLG